MKEQIGLDVVEVPVGTYDKLTKKVEEMFSNDEFKYLQKEIRYPILYQSSEGVDEGSTDFKYIFTGKYTSREHALLCICHEYGHCKSNEVQKEYNITSCATLYDESVAWHYGLIKFKQIEKYFEINVDMDAYYSWCLKEVRGYLKSYYDSEYNELRSKGEWDEL